MRRFGIHALVWTGDWTPEDCRRAVAATAACGFDLIEIPLLRPDAVDVADTRAVLEQHGVAAACSLGLSAETDVSSEDTATVDAGRALLGRAVQVAAGLGADCLSGVLYGALGRYTAPPSRRGARNAVAAVRDLRDEAADLGVTIGIEVVNRYESNLLNTARQALDFIAETGRDDVVVHLDTYHMSIEERSLGDAIRECGDRLGYFHVGESHRGALGTGTIDWVPVFSALESIAYDGPITFESFSSAVVDRELSSTLCIWREPWSDGMELARDARRFLEVHQRP